MEEKRNQKISKKQRLLISYKVNGSMESRDLLIRSYINLAKYHSTRYSMALDLPIDELLSYAYEGIIVAIDKCKLSEAQFLTKRVSNSIRHSLCRGVIKLLGMSRNDYYVFKELQDYIEKDLKIPFNDTLDTYDMIEKIDTNEIFEKKFLNALKNRCKIRNWVSYDRIVDGVNRKLDAEESDPMYNRREFNQNEAELLQLYSAFNNVVVSTIIQEETRKAVSGLLDLLSPEEKDLILRSYEFTDDDTKISHEERTRIWNIIRKLATHIRNGSADDLHITNKSCNLSTDEYYDNSINYHSAANLRRKKN